MISIGFFACLTSCSTKATVGAKIISAHLDLAYTANSGTNNISVFSLASGTGLLTLLETVPTITTPATASIATAAPSGVFVHPSKKYLYAANYGSNTIAAFAINQSTGYLTPIGATLSGQTPAQLFVHPGGNYVYSVNTGAKTVTLHIVQQTGLLSAPTLYATAYPPAAIAGNRAGTYLFVTLNGVSGAALTTANLQPYTISPTTGFLTPNGAAVNAGNNPLYMAVNAAGTNLYVANSDNNLINFAISSSGTLSPVGTAVPAGTSPLQPAIDLAGQFLVVDNAGGTGTGTSPAVGTTLSQYAINQSNGALTYASNITVGNNPQDNEFSPDGEFLYVLNANDNTVTQLSYTAGTGATSAIATTATGGAPYSIALIRIPQ